LPIISPRPRIVGAELLEAPASKQVLAASQALAEMDVCEREIADEILELLAFAN
jgi:hypothetical protein